MKDKGDKFTGEYEKVGHEELTPEDLALLKKLKEEEE